MRQIKDFFGRLKDGYSKLSWAGLFLLIVCFIPDWQGRIDYWAKELRSVFPYLASGWGRTSLVILGIIVIWLDHRRVLAKREKGHDDKTLQGRTRAFCGELRAFQKELGPEPPLNWKASESARSFTEANKTWIERGQRMHHFFHLRFYDKAVGLWHEHGAEMRESAPLGNALASRIDEDEKLNAVVKMFSELAQD